MDHPQHLGDLGSETKDTLLVFPTAFPIKAMGRMKATETDAANQNFAQTVLEIVQKHAPDFDATTMELRPSKNGNFISVTTTINATSKLQLDDLYRELSSHPAVLMAL